MDELYNEIEKLIGGIVGHEGAPYELGAFSGFGWLHARTPSEDEAPSPIAVIKIQKNAVHIYYAFWLFDEDEKKRFLSVFGKSAMGKSCIRIRKMTAERKEALEFIINKSMKTIPAHTKVPL